MDVKWFNACYTINTLYTDIRYNDKTHHNDILDETIPQLNIRRNIGDIKNIIFNTPRDTCSGYLLESHRLADSIKYPQHIFLRVSITYHITLGSV